MKHDEYFSYVLIKGGGGGGGREEIPRYNSDFFFVFIQICLS